MDTLLSEVQSVLETHFSQPITLGQFDELDSQFTVLRLSLLDNNLPDTVIVKHIPDDARFGADKRFRSEWTGLEFINTLDGDFAGNIITGDMQKRIIILEDLGVADDLNAHLHNLNVDGDTLLEEFGTFLGAMQASSIGRGNRYYQLQSGYEATPPLADGNLDLRNFLDRLEVAFAPNTAMTSHFIDEVQALSSRIHDDEQFKAFCHCDLGPHNVLVTDKGLRLVDFEFSSFTNPVMDAVPAYCAFPPFSKGYPIPAQALAKYETAYRNTLSVALPQILKDDIFNPLREACCTQWMLSKFIGIPEKIYPMVVHNQLENPEQDQRISRRRHMTINVLSAYFESLGSHARYNAIHNVLHNFYQTLRDNFPDIKPAPYYEAFST